MAMTEEVVSISQNEMTKQVKCTLHARSNTCRHDAMDKVNRVLEIG
jgi:hypothetical protein